MEEEYSAVKYHRPHVPYNCQAKFDEHLQAIIDCRSIAISGDRDFFKSSVIWPGCHLH